MNDPRLDYEKRRYIAIREKLLADDPDIDDCTLADTTEGLTDLTELLAAIMRGALDDESLVVALKLRMADMAGRLDRFEARAQRRREIVREAMLDAHMEKLQQPDFTASIRRGQPHAVVVDESLIPETFWEHRPHLRKRELLDALKDGTAVAGAVLSNPGMTLSVRTK